MNAERDPDAVRSPLSYAGPGTSFARLSRLQSEFAQVLRVDRIFVRHQGTEHFISGRHEDTLNVLGPGAHAGKSLYAWEDRGDGVFYGYLTSHD